MDIVNSSIAMSMNPSRHNSITIHRPYSKIGWFQKFLFLSTLFVCRHTTQAAQSILNGRYQTSIDVQDYLDLAVDAAAMKGTTDLALKESIYTQGVSGTSTVTLQSLSLNAEAEMSLSPFYNIFRHAFLTIGQVVEEETAGSFDGQPIEVYADTLVQDLFELNLQHIETEAAIVMSVWMACAHQLFELLLECQANDSIKGMAALDKAVAMWVGAGEVTGSNDAGSLLYNLAENAGERFGQDNGETRVNSFLMQAFNELQSDFASQCTTDQGYRQMREKVGEMTGQMTVPLIQNLIHHSKTFELTGQGEKFVSLYALSIIPRVSACDPAAYENELELEALRSIQQDQVATAIQTLQETYSCFRVSCADVGAYLGGIVPQCVDSSTTRLAGYVTDRFEPTQLSTLDRDILAIDIFLRFQAYGAAEDWYTYGWNSASNGLSLKSLATNQLVPSDFVGSYTGLFQAYFQDPSFADSMIINALDQLPPYNSATKEQIRQSIVGILRNVVVFTTSATALQYAVQVCEVDSNEALNQWDTGALLYIGSMEGPRENGSPLGGEFMFATAKETCPDFGTCISLATFDNEANVAAVNANILQGLNQAVGSMSTGTCDVARNLLNTLILPGMLVPLMQGTIKYASFNQDLPSATTDSSLAIGDAFARGILPIVAESDPSSASTIQFNMELQYDTQPVSQGFTTVADALRSALPNMLTSCEDIGQFEDEPNDGNMCIAGGTPGNQSPVSAPTTLPGSSPSESPSELAWGRYQFQTEDGLWDADFALDIRDIWEGAGVSNLIYTDGKNSQRGLLGNTAITSLQSLNTEVVAMMKNEPTFNVYKYALYAERSLDGSPDSFTFADDVVLDALVDAQDNQLGANAALVMNVFQLMVHRLEQSYQSCKSGINPVAFIDSAVALWIGQDQKSESSEDGWMLYALAEKTASRFGIERGEAPVNKLLMERFNALQATAYECDNRNAYVDMYYEVQETIQVLNKSLLLAFLSLIFEGNKNMVELLAVSIIPQAVACDASVASTLEGTFIQNFSVDKITDNVKESLITFLRCQRLSSADLETGASIGGDLLDLVNDIKSGLNSYSGASDFVPLAGYAPNSDVSEMARMDLDSLWVQIMMRTGALDAADDIYRLGRNAYSQETSRYLSFATLMLETKSTRSDMYEIYSDYYGSSSFVDDTMTDLLSPSGSYSSRPEQQLPILAHHYLQGLVSYLAIYGKMEDAFMNCQSNNIMKAVNDWDSAVALFIGFREGLFEGGRQDGDGEFLYSLSEKVCNDFGLCSSTGATVENEVILFAMASGRDALDAGSCDYVRRLSRDNLTPKFSNLVVQGFLSFAIQSQSVNSEDANEPMVGAHVYSKILVPIVNKVNSTAASLVQDSYGELRDITIAPPLENVIEGLAHSLRGMGITCKDLNFPQFSLCLDDGSDNDGLAGNVPNEAPLPETPTDLGDGLYLTKTFVQDRADIAKDIAEIDEALMTNNFNLAKLIYNDGKNSNVYDTNGKFQSLRSLQKFSSEETMEMIDEPLFNMFKYSLSDSGDRFMSRDVRLYADSMVQDAFTYVTSDDTKTLPTEAALIFNLWMHLAHSLYDTLKHCKNKEITDEEGIHSMDIAVAYWIGDGQVAGSGNNGHLFYAMAERMGEIFNIDQGGQSQTNTDILKLFNEVKEKISLPDACSDDPASYLQIAGIANEILALMAIPLIQSLIHALRMDDRQRVRLYAHAVVPLIAGCDPEPYEYLKDKLFTPSYDVIEVDFIIDRLRSTYPCLGLTCSDIGLHGTEMADESKQCQDPDVLSSLAGYNPTNDVREFSQLDLDLRQLDILLQTKAYDAAENLYIYGKHANGDQVGSMSLFHLATTSDRSIVPEYDLFVDYYQDSLADPSIYADNIIRSALNNVGGRWNDAQRRQIVLKSSQVLVSYFAALQSLYEAVSQCRTASQSGGIDFTEKWDQGAAFLIGSLEGTTVNGAQYGHMYYDLAQEYCVAFGTCTSPDASVSINDELITRLYAGRGAAQNGGCNELRSTADKISSLLLIPVIQGALFSALKLTSGGGNSDIIRAEGYVYSRALLPLVANVDRDAARSLNRYLGRSAPSSPERTTSEVFSALAKVYSAMEVDCKKIGTIDGKNPCDGVDFDEGISSVVWIVLGSVLGLCALAFFVYYRRRSKSSEGLPENNPRFITPVTGELNHSMDLLQKAFSSTSNRITPHGQSAETVALTEDLYTDASPRNDDDDFDEVTRLKSRMDSHDVDII